MSDRESLISVENVSKRFRFQSGKAADLREKFSALRRKRGAGEATPAVREDFWALKDVSFLVQPGQPVGVIGHNGSGKSTLLKILNGIYPPTSGTVKVKGRVGALIEVGAGFHPDLTGRENVYLNGAILGLSRREIAKKFDRIVEFANLEAFIDTPVKRYSSGMYMRLGFSVAAHTEPDILLIDEILAVGDALFQNKCLKYLKEFVARGGAVLFVSHGMSQIADLCETCVWLDYGEMRYHGPTDEALAQYAAVVQEREEEEFRRLYPTEWEAQEQDRKAAEAVAQAAEEVARQAERDAWERERLRIAARKADMSDPQASRLLGVLLKDADGVTRERFETGEPMSIQIAYRFGQEHPDPVFGIDIFRNDGLHMFTTSNYDHQVSFHDLPQEGIVTLDVSLLSLNEGRYRIQVNLFAESSSPHWFDHPLDELTEAATFEVYAGRFANGCCFVPTSWRAEAEVPTGASVERR